MREAERLSLPDAVLLNTFDALEQPVLDAMRAVLPPMYPVGPLHLHASNVVPTGTPLDGLGSNLWKEQDGLLAWLDGHGAGAVVYVNYGSVAVMTTEQLLEFGWGLADSGYAFIWNVRPDLVRGETAVMPPEFLASVHGRAMLTTWCPQAEVLGHEAVGVCLTHSGWNSTRESISAVVPMLCWPFAGEQQTNCRDGDRRRGEAGGSGGDDTRGDGGGKGTGDEAACGGVEGEGPACVAARKRKSKRAQLTLPRFLAAAGPPPLLPVLRRGALNRAKPLLPRRRYRSPAALPSVEQPLSHAAPPSLGAAAPA
uniref:UDP-glycosyltransferases domain-containing protein n=1 Tax=Aegilops tauschii TaxID=37682 RepID=R7WBP1_AEGTA